MNILIINKYYYVTGGPERYLFSIIPFLEKTGYKVIPLALDLHENEKSPYSLHFLPSPFGPTAGQIDLMDSGYLEKMELALRSFYYSKARQVVRKLVNDYDISAVYLLNICNYISPSVIDGAKEAGASVIMRLSDYNFICASHHFLRNGNICTACEKNVANAIKYRCVKDSWSGSLIRAASIWWHRHINIYDKVDAFIAPSRYMKEALTRFGISANRLWYIPSFVDVNVFKPTYEAGRYVLYFGRLSKEKGINTLLKAWQLLGIKAPPLMIMGQGQDKDELVKIARETIKNNLEFREFGNKETVVKAIQGSAYVVIPSICHDNFPMAACEAMACGKPLIGSDLGGLRDQIVHKETGLRVPPGDPDALAEAAIAMWTDKELCKQYGIAARERVEREYLPEVHLTRLDKVFKMVSN